MSGEPGKPIGILNLALYIGDSFLRPIQIVDQNDEPIVQPGMTPHIQVRKTAGGTIVADWDEAYFNVDEETAIYSLTVPPEDTELLEPRTYYWDFQLENADGSEVRTYVGGNLIATGDITR